MTNEELLYKIERLEELQLQLSVFNAYVSDKNNFDMNKILFTLFTIPKNIEIIKSNLTDKQDEEVLARVVEKWKVSAVKRAEYNH